MPLPSPAWWAKNHLDTGACPACQAPGFTVEPDGKVSCSQGCDDLVVLGLAGAPVWKPEFEFFVREGDVIARRLGLIKRLPDALPPGL